MFRYIVACKLNELVNEFIMFKKPMGRLSNMHYYGLPLHCKNFKPIEEIVGLSPCV
jgi:hypothetical protein